MRLLKTSASAGKTRELPAARKRASAKRRPVPRIKIPSRGTLMLAGVGFFAALTVAGGWWMHSAGAFERAGLWLDETARDATAAAGFRVEGVFVDGRAETEARKILLALDIRIGDPILFVDPEEARQRLEALGWVRQAQVERRLPNTLIVRLQERKALAIWQRGGSFDLIDQDGAVIGTDGLSRYGHLLVVVGEGAEREAAHLIGLLEQEPALRNRLEAAVRVGERRWNLRFKGGIDVRLPELDVEGAVKRLAELDRQYDLIGADIRLIDLRQKDRMVVQPTHEAAERRRVGPGDRT